MKLTRGAVFAASVVTLLTAGLAAVLLFAAGSSLAATETAAASLPAEVIGWGFLSAALAAGASAIGAAYAVGRVGSAAVGALTEKPELLGRVLILVGLAEGIAIYGLIIAILILNRLT
ncbi:MAG TPA: ATP synthase subunit C [Woeseiaceae bacterium]